MRLLAMLLMFMPSIHQPSLFCQKQICHSKTAIKLTWCSLSHPLIKGRYPVYGLASGSGVSSQPPCIILTWGCCDMSATGWESMKRWRFAALLRFCDERQRCLLFTSSWRMWVRSLSLLSVKMSCCLRAVFRRCVGAVIGSGPGDLASNKLLLKTFPPPGCLRYF